ncbi:HAMP domain-containing protein [Mesorhizobium sp. AD1-1]|uniref:ATP-binding protein n=1 Tax=Mesorhizobium sp. AD1-1 TaxID=2876621 RepID=UPI001CCB21F9|nr:ATP-binding protein [Mesorhizobium sp. AD1-1]MBZ9719201.1 HAMP domain-containing protein [Mesorhizobium sp. AD1-1]
MSFSDRLRLGSITTQITGIVAISVLLGAFFTIATVLLFADGAASKASPSAAAQQIAQIVELMQAANSGERAAILQASRKAGVKVVDVAISELEPAVAPSLPSMSRLIERQLESGWGIDMIEGDRYSSGPEHQLVARIDDDTALVFDASTGTNLWRLIWAPTALTLVIVLVFIVLLSVYAVRWIIAPLSSLAEAAHSFGRHRGAEQAVSRNGPREIADVADALNEMRTRIRSLLDDRTRMLAAISHDLRTPLTRLRLRVERVTEDGLRDGMLHEIEQISHMLDETISYLREDARSEDTSRVDLPSLLQTICADFADVGHNISYKGPSRLTWLCRPSALTRAISNIVANGAKHGEVIDVRLSVGGDGKAEIDVSDNGPGIPDDLRERVFEPFFKADNARAIMGGGFGLGLSIARDIVQGHGGGIELIQRQPHGLTARITLPSMAVDPNDNARSDAAIFLHNS